MIAMSQVQTVYRTASNCCAPLINQQPATPIGSFQKNLHNRLPNGKGETKMEQPLKDIPATAAEKTSKQATTSVLISSPSPHYDEACAELSTSKIDKVDQWDYFDLQKIDCDNAKAAPMVALLDKCLRCFDDDGNLIEQNNLPTALFLIHQWYMPSTELVTCFLQLYNASIDRCPFCHKAASLLAGRAAGGVPKVGNEPMIEEHDLRTCATYEYRLKLCSTLRHWIRVFPIHFDENEALRRMIGQLQQTVSADIHAVVADSLDLSAVPSYAWMRNVSVRNPVIRQFSLSFDQWTPEEIANNITHIEYRLLRRITFGEYKRYAECCVLAETPILERSISTFNSLSSWVQCMVLSKPTAKERAEIMTKFINVSKELQKLQNFNTMMAVVGGLTHSALARLTKTHACLSAEMKKDLIEMGELLSQLSNFSNYRKALNECTGFRIPIIGVHLKDLISLHAAMPDFCDQMINCSKLCHLSCVCSHLLLDLQRPHNLAEPNLDLINTLKVSLDIRYKEEEIYELSLKREPKTLLTVYSGTPKQVVFADWAAGVSTAPDPETVDKHVSAMVEAVFKHYDHDRDGYISKAEFESITGNFPFLDPFVILDADRDGQISKNEMCQYFVKVNHLSIELRRGFKHNFHETTFLTPTTCVHCNKLLWGIIRQGYKCKDCGLPVHKSCKDSVVAECRNRKGSGNRLSYGSRSVSCSEEAGPSNQGRYGTQVSANIPCSNAAASTSASSAAYKRRMFLTLRQVLPKDLCLKGDRTVFLQETAMVHDK